MRAILAFLAGLVATPLVTYGIGYALYGARDTWNVGQGESFLVFFVCLWTTPFGALYWALVAHLLGKSRKGYPVGKLFLVAGAFYLVAIALTLVAFGAVHA